MAKSASASRSADSGARQRRGAAKRVIHTEFRCHDRHPPRYCRVTDDRIRSGPGASCGPKQRTWHRFRPSPPIRSAKASSSSTQKYRNGRTIRHRLDYRCPRSGPRAEGRQALVVGAYGAAAVVRPTARLDGGRLKVLAAIGAFRRGDNVLNLLTKGLIAVSAAATPTISSTRRESRVAGSPFHKRVYLFARIDDRRSIVQTLLHLLSRSGWAETPVPTRGPTHRVWRSRNVEDDGSWALPP